MNAELKSLLLSTDPVGELRELHSSGKLVKVEKTLAELKMDIPKGYHHKDNLEHSFIVLQHSIDREETPDLILRTAALFHDIGKPATREFHGRGKVSFTNHDIVGARIARKVLRTHGFVKADVEAITKLIAMHMRSHTFKTGWTESAVRRLSTEAGSDLQLERLVKIFYSDATTKHADKMKQIHGNVSELAAEMHRVKEKDARAARRPAIDGLEVAALLGIAPGPALGPIMKFLYTDEVISLDRETTIQAVRDFVTGE